MHTSPATYQPYHDALHQTQIETYQETVLQTYQKTYQTQLCPQCTDTQFKALVAAEPIQDGKPIRKYAELLQEIRIAQGGSQVMLAYLMSLVFTNRFDGLNHLERIFYLAALVLSVAATAQLVAPTFFRNLTFRHRSEEDIADHAVRCVQSGLMLLMLSIVCSLLFGLYAVFQLSLAMTVAATTFMWFLAWWYVLPLWVRTRRATAGPKVNGKGRRRR
jgi:hypothetical protein